MSKFININQSNFKKVISKKNKLILVEVTATWCGACKSLDAILQETLTNYPDKIEVGILDVDQNTKLVEDLKIMSVPTIIVFRDGQEKKRIFGQVSKEEMLKEIEIYGGT